MRVLVAQVLPMDCRDRQGGEPGRLDGALSGLAAQRREQGKVFLRSHA